VPSGARSRARARRFRVAGQRSVCDLRRCVDAPPQASGFCRPRHSRHADSPHSRRSSPGRVCPCRRGRGAARTSRPLPALRARAAPSSISRPTTTRSSPRAREAPPIPAGERLRRAAAVAPTRTNRVVRRNRVFTCAVGIEEPRAGARLLPFLVEQAASQASRGRRARPVRRFEPFVAEDAWARAPSGSRSRVRARPDPAFCAPARRVVDLGPRGAARRGCRARAAVTTRLHLLPRLSPASPWPSRFEEPRASRVRIPRAAPAALMNDRWRLMPLHQTWCGCGIYRPA